MSTNSLTSHHKPLALAVSAALAMGLAGPAIGQFTSVVQLSDLDGTNGFKLDGEFDSDHSGFSVSNAGDVNGDGVDDLLIGAPYADSNGSDSGRVYVIFGRTDGIFSTIQFSSLDGDNGFMLDGEGLYFFGDRSGFSVSTAGDINGDGIGDIIIGAPSAEFDGCRCGRSYVVFGKSDGFPARVPLSSLDGINGFTLDGKEPGGSNSGFSVSTAGDINGDGFDDLIIGAPYAVPNGAGTGRSYVVFGRPDNFPARVQLSSLSGDIGFTLDGEKVGIVASSGASVSKAGDVNGDEINDLIIGAPKSDSNGTNSGRVYVIFGNKDGFPATVQLSSLNGFNGFKLDGEDQFDFSGTSVSDAGDINGDGVDDFIIGGPGVDPNNIYIGRSYVVFGMTDGFPPTLQLSDLNGANGFKIDGEVSGAGGGARSGFSVGNAGDINGDGVNDLIIGAPYASQNGFNSGRSYVVFGSSDGFSAIVQLSNLNGDNGFILDGEGADGGISGFSVSTAGDINDDGLDDLIIGAPRADLNGCFCGRSYVLFGKRNDIIFQDSFED